MLFDPAKLGRMGAEADHDAAPRPVEPGPATLEAWYLLHKEKRDEYYHALVASLPQR